MNRLRYALALVLAYVAGYAMRRQPPGEPYPVVVETAPPCPDDVAPAGVDLVELQRRSYRAGEADGRAASIGSALRLAGERRPRTYASTMLDGAPNDPRSSWRQGYRAGWEELAHWCRGEGHPGAPYGPMDSAGRAPGSRP